MHQYLYQIAGIRILLCVPQAITIQKESEKFLTQIGKKEQLQQIDIEITFTECQEIPKSWGNGHKRGDNYYLKEQREMIFFCSASYMEPYAYLEWEEDYRRATFFYLPGEEHRFAYSHNLCDIMGLENVLHRQQGILLHASFIRFQEEGILFSAPSGTGKSTQARLWQEYEDAEILNGDRAGVMKRNGEWISYGLPYAGSSRIYRNESAILRAIVVLRQAKENKIRRLSVVEATRYLYPEVSLHHWDKVFTEETVDDILRLLKDIPVYLLECLPDKSAVNLAKTTIFE